MPNEITPEIIMLMIADAVSRVDKRKPHSFRSTCKFGCDPESMLTCPLLDCRDTLEPAK